jgi:hypothetical protein
MAITGRVLDPEGGPVPSVFVTALEKASDGRPFRFVDARLRAMTNSKGEYRLDGLYANDFYLIALPHNGTHDERGNLKRTGFGNTFYPGVPTFAEATSVRVAPGVTPTADITLLPTTVHKVSGIVLGPDGRAVPGGILRLTHGDGFFGLDTRILPIEQDGTFRAEALQPGTYFLQFREGPARPRRGVTPKISQAKVTVADTDMTDVRVAPLQMVRGRGRLVIDAPDRGALDLSLVRISAFPDPIDGNPGPQQPGIVRPDLTFAFATWPQPARIQARIDAPGWTVKAVRHRGIDVTDTPIDFTAGKDITGLEVVIGRP